MQVHDFASFQDAVVSRRGVAEKYQCGSLRVSVVCYPVHCQMDDRVFFRRGVFERRFCCFCASEYAVTVTMSFQLSRKNLLPRCGEVGQPPAYVSAHRCDFSKLRILLVRDATDAEKYLLRGPWHCGLNQIQEARGRRVGDNTRKDQVTTANVDQCVEGEEMEPAIGHDDQSLLLRCLGDIFQQSRIEFSSF